jgi:hypothetical protein
VINQEQRIREYITSRAARVSEGEAVQVSHRAAELWSRNRPIPGRVFRISLGAALALAVLVGGVLLQVGLSSMRHPIKPVPGVQLPDEIVGLWPAKPGPETSSGMGVQPVRIRDGKLLPPKPVGTGLVLSKDESLVISDTAGDCSVRQSLIHVVDPGSNQDRRPPVSLPGCYLGGLLLPDGTVLFEHISKSSRDVVRYDWKRGQIVRVYPDLSFTPESLLSRDGRRLYTLEYGRGCCPSWSGGLTFTDLETGNRVTQFQVDFEDFGFLRAMALSPDGRTLYINIKNGGVATFDTVKGTAGPQLHFEVPVARTWFPFVVQADAKEALGSSIAVDPKGRWVAVLAVDSRLSGIWIVSAGNEPRVLKHLHPQDTYRALASSLDGSALYALEVAGAGRYLLLLDPNTGRDLTEFTVRESPDPQRDGGFEGIAWVEPRPGAGA